jgi:formylglycine-generating enzyme required for sulfatase activity
MAWIPGGEFTMGTDAGCESLCSRPGTTFDSTPVHRVRVGAFWIDVTEVTNEQFAAFVAATGWITVAERPPSAEEFPDALPELLVPGSLVFTPSDGPADLDQPLAWWRWQPGANWRHPAGPGSDLVGRERHPVVHVAFADAEAYARFHGKRLPTSAEWEFAARGGLDGRRYAWGDELTPDGRHQANLWQGEFPRRGGDTGADGFVGLAPVAQFPGNGFGLHDVAGNVWEWCSDWYRPDAYAARAGGNGAIVDPRGPADSFDPAEPGARKRVQRGGSFLCSDQWCSRYLVGTVGRGEESTGSDHVGFRCVRNE